MKTDLAQIAILLDRSGSMSADLSGMGQKTIPGGRMNLFNLIKKWLEPELKTDFRSSVRYAEVRNLRRFAGLDPYVGEIASSARAK